MSCQFIKINWQLKWHKNMKKSALHKLRYNLLRPFKRDKSNQSVVKVWSPSYSNPNSLLKSTKLSGKPKETCKKHGILYKGKFEHLNRISRKT